MLDYAKERGYQEITLGVEEDNLNAMHIYQKYGFNKLIKQKRETVNGRTYDFNLYLKI